MIVPWEIGLSKLDQDYWSAEMVDAGGEIKSVHFFGPNSRRQAEEFVAWRTSEDDERTRS